MTCKYAEVLSPFHAWRTWRREQLSDSSKDTGKPAAGHGSPRCAPRPTGRRRGLIVLTSPGAAAGVRARGRSRSAAGRRRWRGPGGPARHGGGRAGSPRRGGVGAVPGQRAEPPPLPEPLRASEAAFGSAPHRSSCRQGGRQAGAARAAPMGLFPLLWACAAAAGAGEGRDGDAGPSPRGARREPGGWKLCGGPWAEPRLWEPRRGAAVPRALVWARESFGAAAAPRL